MEPGKTERVYRRIAKFAEKVYEKEIWTRKIKKEFEKNECRQRIFRTFVKLVENKTKMYCLVLEMEDNVQISEKQEDSWDLHMK